MPYHDLALPYTPDTRSLSTTLSFAAELGYTTLALTTTLPVSGKLPSKPPTIDLSPFSAAHPDLMLLTRLTLPLSDPSQNHRLPEFSAAFSLLALRPLTEKTLQLACTSLDCDIISLDLSQRLPCLLKFSTLSAALQRGIRFEIAYSPALTGDSNSKRNLIAGATSLIRATRGRGVIVSSEAKSALGLRGPHDVMNLCQVWGAEQARGKEALCEEAGKVVRLAELKRRSYRGVITVVDGVGQKTVEGPAKEAALAGQPVVAGASNGVKRKASTSSVAHDHLVHSTAGAITSSSAPPGTAAETDADGKPLSKRELKRRAKKARLEGYVSSGKEGGQMAQEKSQAEAQGKASEGNGFPVKHETLDREMAKQKEKENVKAGQLQQQKKKGKKA
jgi:ribonuclease P/MRP protein subunit RPP1